MSGTPPREPDLPPGQGSADEPSIWDVPDRWHAPASWDAQRSSSGTPPASTPGSPSHHAAAEPGRATDSSDPAVATRRPLDRGRPAAGVRHVYSGPPARAEGRRRRLLLAAAAGLIVIVTATVTAIALLPADGGSPGVGQGGSAASPSAEASQAVSGSAGVDVPILMYHLIAAPPADATHPNLYVRPAVFARQMKYLHDEGYHVISLDRVFDAWAGKATMPTRPVVVSFDDGYPSHYQTAAPIMEQYGWKGLLNADWKVLDESPRLLAQVRLLAAAGWEMGSHSVSHPDLTTLSPDQLEEEVAGSRAMLHERLGVAIDFFCYPAGRYDDAVVAAVEAAGYRGATTTDPGLARMGEPYRLKRVRVTGMPLEAFAAAVRSDTR